VQSNHLIPMAITVLLCACGSGDPEKETVDAFLTAIQQGDQAGAERVSMAAFDGTPASWEIIERGTEQDGAFQLADLEAELEKKRDLLRAQREEFAKFNDDNRDTYALYTKTYAENPSAPFQGELLTFHEQRQEMQGAIAQLEVDGEQLALDVEGLKNAATLSTRTPVDENFEGLVKVKPLQVRINDGSEEKVYTVVLQRYELTDTRLARSPSARWIVAEIQPGS